MDIAWKPLSTQYWQPLHAVPVGMAKVVTADDLYALSVAQDSGATSAALLTPHELRTLTDQLHPDPRHVAEAAEKCLAALRSIPELKNSPFLSGVSIILGSADVGLVLRDAQWKEVPHIVLKILGQADAACALAGRPIPVAISFVIKAANFGVSLCGQFRDEKELAGSFAVMTVATNCSTLDELREKWEAMTTGKA